MLQLKRIIVLFVLFIAGCGSTSQPPPFLSDVVDQGYNCDADVKRLTDSDLLKGGKEVRQHRNGVVASINLASKVKASYSSEEYVEKVEFFSGEKFGDKDPIEFFGQQLIEYGYVENKIAEEITKRGLQKR